MKIVREVTPTIMNGRVVRLYLRRDDGSPMWANEPEVNASRDGVSLCGAWPIMPDLFVLREALTLAEREYLDMREAR